MLGARERTESLLGWGGGAVMRGGRRNSLRVPTCCPGRIPWALVWTQASLMWVQHHTGVFHSLGLLQ